MTRPTVVYAEVNHVLRSGVCVALSLEGYAEPFMRATMETPEEGGIYLERVINEAGADIRGTLGDDDFDDLEDLLRERVADSERWI